MNHAKIRDKTAPPLIFNTAVGAALTFVNESCGGIMYNILRFSNIMISYHDLAQKFPSSQD